MGVAGKRVLKWRLRGEAIACLSIHKKIALMALVGPSRTVFVCIVMPAFTLKAVNDVLPCGTYCYLMHRSAGLLPSAYRTRNLIARDLPVRETSS